MKNVIIVVTIIISLLFAACDRQGKIAIVRNNLKDSVVIIPSDGDYLPLTDSALCNDLVYMQDFYSPNEERIIALPNRFYNKANDSVYVYLDVLNLDSLNFYKSKKLCVGIVKRSLIKTIKIQANKITDPVDTVILN